MASACDEQDQSKRRRLVTNSSVDAKSTFESISSIHIYSLQPTVLQDLNVLTDVHREMLAAHAHEDPLEYGKQWGMIQNKNVKVTVLKFVAIDLNELIA
jgi:hypothetical protein